MRKTARTAAALAALANASLSSAAPVFGTKSDSIASAQGGAQGVGMIPFLQMMAALAIVFLLIKFGLPKIAKALQKKPVGGSESAIKIEETTPIVGGNLYVINVRDKTFLVGASHSGIQCLADLTAGKAAIQPEQPLFMDILERETQSPSLAVAQAPSAPAEMNGNAMTEDEIRAAIDRIGELGI